MLDIIYGYEGKILTCDFSDFFQCDPLFFLTDTDPLNPTNSKILHIVDAWFTIVTSTDGDPITASFMTSDDYLLGDLRGNSQGKATDWISKNSDGTFNITTVNDFGDKMILENLDPLLDDTSIGSYIIVPFTINSTNTASPIYGYHGFIKATRRL